MTSGHTILLLSHYGVSKTLVEKKSVFAAFRVIFVDYPVGWYLRDVHTGKRNVSGSIKREMTTFWSELIGMMEKR